MFKDTGHFSLFSICTAEEKFRTMKNKIRLEEDELDSIEEYYEITYKNVTKKYSTQDYDALIGKIRLFIRIYLISIFFFDTNRLFVQVQNNHQPYCLI